MIKFTVSIVMAILLTGICYADDPGERDSIIVETVFAELGDSTVDVRIYTTTDDSVGYYNIPLTWNSVGDSSTGIYPVNISYYYPITQWDFYWDSVFIAEQFIRMRGQVNGGDPDPPLITNNNRWHCWTLHFVIDSIATSQIVIIDTTYDPINGSLLFGLFGGVISLVPDFTPGAIFYGVTSDNSENEQTLPTQITLSQNYPNPFNASTSIKYSLPEAGHVTIEIYDLLGRQLKILIDDHKQAGVHSITFDASDLSSGVYFYRLQARDMIETKRMVLLK